MALSNAITPPTETQDDVARPDGRVAASIWRRRAADIWPWLFALPLGLAIGWEAAVAYGLFAGRLMPPPSRIIAALSGFSPSTAISGCMFWATLWRVLVGFGFGAIAGMALGAIFGGRAG